ncbi:MAG: hypothetical protein LBE81_12025 [Azonexus sp.]|jgi:hypothetical protein|uniref:hypothetical protein n=1 Tax=Azonexus sp. TaxID=1872668 RepID=UPI002836D04C|nr:hypothetical protein [Azonexus sp.]MDR0777347.1 hypothetical protein [Azonexus sp.]
MLTPASTLVRLLVFSFSLGLSAVAFSAEKPGLPAGFIAMSESKMSWVNAKAWCQQQGGRLPRINNSDSLKNVPDNAVIDGFGALGSPWAGRLPSGLYWTGTVNSDYPNYSYVVTDFGGGLVDNGVLQSLDNRVLCVP